MLSEEGSYVALRTAARVLIYARGSVGVEGGREGERERGREGERERGGSAPDVRDTGRLFIVVIIVGGVTPPRTVDKRCLAQLFLPLRRCIVSDAHHDLIDAGCRRQSVF